MSSLNFSWADEMDNEINEIHKNIEEEFQRKENEKIPVIPYEPNIEAILKDKTIKDEPVNFNKEYLKRDNMYSKTPPVITKTIHKTMEWKVVSHKRKGKCYTCHPRKKVTDHIISTNNGITFHHDMCNRNVIVATPKRHYSTFEKCSPKEVGDIFKEIYKFCNFWNIEDYSVIYNQGEWQTHDHFHVKIKTHENIVNRLRKDHFQRKLLEKRYCFNEKKGNAV